MNDEIETRACPTCNGTGRIPKYRVVWKMPLNDEAKCAIVAVSIIIVIGIVIGPVSIIIMFVSMLILCLFGNIERTTIKNTIKGETKEENDDE